MASSKVGFEFPLDTSQEWSGFNDAGIEHFSGNPFEYLGREVTQNTLDAIVGSPGRIYVRYIEVPTDSIPDVDGLRVAVNACLAVADKESAKAKAFFEEAVAALERQKVGVLQISDFNTTGVCGPCENGRPYFALMKATGQSKKSSDSAAGSFGIGKFAPYTASTLRTVFLTTVWKDDGGSWQHYCQGKAILMSHVVNSNTRRGTGYWGIREKCLPVIGPNKLVPQWLTRPTSSTEGEGSPAGTTLSILGFVARKGWEYLLAANVIENFFGAIATGQLEVNIEGGPSITSATLAQLFEDPQIIESLSEQKGEPEKLESRAAFLKALSSPESKVEHTQNEKLGNCTLHVLVAENLPKKVATLRSGMLITDALNKLQRFGDFKEFAAVLQCHSVKGNALLRAMEPPRHDDFEPERLPTDKEKRAARIALREITSWVRSMLARHAKDPVSEVTTLDELAEFFGDPDGENGKKGSEEDPMGRFNVRARPLKRKAASVAPTEAEIGTDDYGLTGEDQGSTAPSEGGTNSSGGGKGPEDPAPPPAGAGVKGGTTTAAAHVVALANLRAIPLTASRRRVAFTAAQGGSFNLEFQDSGADSNRDLPVIATTAGTVLDGKVRGVAVSSGERVTLEVEFGADFTGTLRVVARAV